MNKLKSEEAKTEIIDHLGLVASVMKDIGLVGKIDSMLPISKEKGAKLTMGERVAGMIFNGLGFVDDRLYMFPKFLANKPIKKLLGQHIEAAYYTDDALGRCLDAVHEFGVTKLFSNLSFSIGMEQGLLGKTTHIDTTSLSLYGEYGADSIHDNTPKPEYGFSKDGQPGLKQMVLNLATTGKASFPVWMEAHSGNGSDNKILPASIEKMENHCQLLQDTPDFIHVADSAMYEGCLNIKRSIKWLCRVPERSKKAKNFILGKESNYEWKDLGNGYHMHVQKTITKGLVQRWALIFSQQAYDKEIKTLEKKISQELKNGEKLLRKMSKRRFSCLSDAKKALKEFTKTLRYHLASNVEITVNKNYEGKGRPRKDDKSIKTYQIVTTLERNEEKIATLQLKKGRFILATNELDKHLLADEEILYVYKEQQKTERGFRFIKGDTFEVSSVFLKKPTRISALMMIMTLCLMIYGLVQYKIRNKLLRQEEYLPNQLGKPTQKPTAQWIFRLFLGIHLLKIHTDTLKQEMVINLTPLLKKIIRLFGKHAMAVYGVTLSV